jgi:hypothetical protein
MKNDDLKWHILDRDDNLVRKCLSPGEAEVVLKELWAKPEEFNFDFRLPLTIFCPPPVGYVLKPKEETTLSITIKAPTIEDAKNKLKIALEKLVESV